MAAAKFITKTAILHSGKTFAPGKSITLDDETEASDIDALLESDAIEAAPKVKEPAPPKQPTPPAT